MWHLATEHLTPLEVLVQCTAVRFLRDFHGFSGNFDGAVRFWLKTTLFAPLEALPSIATMGATINISSLMRISPRTVPRQVLCLILTLSMSMNARCCPVIIYLLFVFHLRTLCLNLVARFTCICKGKPRFHKQLRYEQTHLSQVSSWVWFSAAAALVSTSFSLSLSFRSLSLFLGRSGSVSRHASRICDGNMHATSDHLLL